MAATVEQVARLRKMIGEPTTTTYSDAALEDIIERYPVLDDDGLAPGETDYAADVYNLNRAAADIWEEKAAAVAHEYDFSASGSSFHQSQKSDKYLELARMYRNRRTNGARLLP